MISCAIRLTNLLTCTWRPSWGVPAGISSGSLAADWYRCDNYFWCIEFADKILIFAVLKRRLLQGIETEARFALQQGTVSASARKCGRTLTVFYWLNLAIGIADFAPACVYAVRANSCPHADTADGLGTYGILCENVTSSSAPEIPHILHCRQKLTEPRTQVTYTENFM